MSDNATISLTEKEFSLFRELIYKEAGIALGSSKQQLSGQLLQTAVDIQDSIVRVSTGFAGMAQQAASAVQLSQCRVQSREGMNKVLDAARKTLDEVDTIAREARMWGSMARSKPPEQENRELRSRLWPMKRNRWRCTPPQPAIC